METTELKFRWYHILLLATLFGVIPNLVPFWLTFTDQTITLYQGLRLVYFALEWSVFGYFIVWYITKNYRYKDSDAHTKQYTRWSRYGFFVVMAAICAVLLTSIHFLVVTLTVPERYGGFTWEQYPLILGYGFPRDFGMFCVFATIGVATNYYNKYREQEYAALRLEQELTQAQLLALKMQLNPHFLFNTMHSIASLIRKKQNEAAVDMIAHLSDLLRYSLKKVDTQVVTLQRELRFIQLWFKIELARWNKRLICKMYISPATRMAFVPSLILQPLVENAIKYGLAKSTTKSYIEIYSRKDNKMLELRVTNTGPTPAEDWERRVEQSVGIKNTRKRLQHLYGKRWSFTLERKDTKTVVTVRFPFEIDTPKDTLSVEHG